MGTKGGIMKKVLRTQKGFTLIELLVVVAILGALSATVLPNVSKFMDEGNIESLRSETHSVQLAVTAMILDQKAGSLSASYTAVQTLADVQSVQAGAATLDEYLFGIDSDGLGQAYDITQNGSVTVH